MTDVRIICGTIDGTYQGQAPPDSVVFDCDLCGTEVSVAGEIWERLATHGAQVLCTGCAVDEMPAATALDLLKLLEGTP